MSQQVADAQTDPEQIRLEAVAALTDPATIRYLRDEIRVAKGWRCAEVGAGTGSIAHWLSTQVGEYGQVVALDIDTQYLRGVESANIEVREQDITTTPLEQEAYDLVHVKILLMHLPERERVISELAAALKPGGFLLVEEADVRSMQRVEPPSPLLTRMASALETFFYFGGAQPGYGMKLQPAVARTGLQILGTDCQLTAVQAGTEAVQTIVLSMGKLAPMVVKAGLMTQHEVDTAFEQLEQPSDRVIYTPITVSVWAQRAS